MTYDEISPTLRAFVGGREAFRKMGFSADHLFCMVAQSARRGGRLACFVTLRAQGREFNLEVGDVDDEDAFHIEYERVCTAINDGGVSEDDLQRMYAESEAFRNATAFAMAIVAKGFQPPRSFS